MKTISAAVLVVTLLGAGCFFEMNRERPGASPDLPGDRTPHADLPLAGDAPWLDQRSTEKEASAADRPVGLEAPTTGDGPRDGAPRDLAPDKDLCLGVNCARPHAQAICDGGICKNFVCDEGWYDCNSTWDDGCETKEDLQHCGNCTTVCPATATNSNPPVCQNHKCTPQCIPPYQDCNKDLSDGCEIPVGVANSCHKNGLGTWVGTSLACGTPYCGETLVDKDYEIAFAGKGWRCRFCVHCHQWDSGDPASNSWCLHPQIGGWTGTFGPKPYCLCGCTSSAVRDQVCLNLPPKP